MERRYRAFRRLRTTPQPADRGAWRLAAIAGHEVPLTDVRLPGSGIRERTVGSRRKKRHSPRCAPALDADVRSWSEMCTTIRG